MPRSFQSLHAAQRRRNVSNDACNPNCSHSNPPPSSFTRARRSALWGNFISIPVLERTSPRYTEPLVRTGRPPRSQLDAEGKETSRIRARLRLLTTCATEEYKVLPPAQWSNPASCHRHGWRLRLPNWTLDITPCLLVQHKICVTMYHQNSRTCTTANFAFHDMKGHDTAHKLR